MHYQQIIVDADLCIKIGGSEKFRFLYDIFPLLAAKIIIHRVVYNEILMPQSVKDQVDALISIGKMEIVDETLLSRLDLSVYNATFKSLAAVMIDPSHKNKNLGEVCSLSYAKTKSIPIFATDERDLQPIIDSRLNTGIDDIKCLRVVDLVLLFKSGEIQGVSRKQAKMLWVIAGKNKEMFDTDLWPLSVL